MRRSTVLSLPLSVRLYDYPSGATFYFATPVGSVLTRKYYTWVKRLARNTHSSLLRTFVKYSHKKAVNACQRQIL
jgi:hypothetical protein